MLACSNRFIRSRRAEHRISIRTYQIAIAEIKAITIRSYTVLVAAAWFGLVGELAAFQAAAVVSHVAGSP